MIRDLFLFALFLLVVGVIGFVVVKNARVERERREIIEQDPSYIQVGGYRATYTIVTLPTGERMFVVFNNSGSGIATCPVSAATTVEKP